mgnify:CR=1 FL=1
MTRSELATAAARLDAAGDATDDDAAADRLGDVAAQLRDLAEADRDPDHGRLARIESKLHDVEDEVGTSAATEIDEAFASIRSFRETLEGV